MCASFYFSFNTKIYFCGQNKTIPLFLCPSNSEKKRVAQSFSHYHSQVSISNKSKASYLFLVDSREKWKLYPDARSPRCLGTILVQQNRTFTYELCPAMQLKVALDSRHGPLV